MQQQPIKSNTMSHKVWEHNAQERKLRSLQVQLQAKLRERHWPEQMNTLIVGHRVHGFIQYSTHPAESHLFDQGSVGRGPKNGMPDFKEVSDDLTQVVSPGSTRDLHFMNWDTDRGTPLVSLCSASCCCGCSSGPLCRPQPGRACCWLPAPAAACVRRGSWALGAAELYQVTWVPFPPPWPCPEVLCRWRPGCCWQWAQY